MRGTEVHRVKITGRTAEAIYDDRFRAIAPRLGDATVERASHVEPASGGGWFADMRPVDGPILFADGAEYSFGAQPWGLMLTGFATREAALAAERGWLRAHRGI